MAPDEPQTQNRTQRRVASMRRSLIDAAEGLLIEGGAAAVTTEEVARRADVSLQTVYNRIGGKSALLIAVAERAVEENRAYMDAAYSSVGSPRERLLLAGDAYIRFALERPHQFRIVANPPDDPEAVRLFTDIADRHLQTLTAVISDCIEAKVVNPDLDPKSTAVALWGMLNGVLSMALRGKQGSSLDGEAHKLVRTALSLLELGVTSR